MEYSTVLEGWEMPAGLAAVEVGSLYRALQSMPDRRAKRGRYEAGLVLTLLLLAKLASKPSAAWPIGHVYGRSG